MPRQPDRTFDVEGQMVRCIELEDDRLWHCKCTPFRERLSRFEEGFCGHVAVAMMRHLAEPATSAI